jgi:hypothetical protein
MHAVADSPSGGSAESIGHFRLDRLLGTGGFATVWLAYDEHLDAFMAIKVLAENWSHNEEIRRRFTEEARILWRMESPHIVRVYGVDVTPEGRPYFVMEYADAGSLEERMKARAEASEPYSIEEALAFSIAVADGLVEAQGRNIVHRDLKPSNILFKRSESGPERLLIADFGIARSLEAAGASTIAAGTPHYMAPEQTEGRADASSDVYSAAVILYEMLAGRVPFPYPSVGQVIRAQITETVPDIRTLRPDVPPGLAAVIARGVGSAPEARQRSAAEWRADLEAASQQRGDGAPGETLGPEALAALAGVAAVGTAGGVAAAATSGGASAPSEHFVAAGPPSTPLPPPGGTGSGGSDASKRRRRRRVLALFLVLALIGGVAGIAVVSSGKVSAEVFRAPANSVGTHPFTKPVAKRGVGGIALTALRKLLKPPARTLAAPKGSPVGSISTFLGNTPGLYGGTQQLSVCDAASMVAFLLANPAKAAAWAGVEGISASQIAAYVATLTDTVLRVDTRVTNHGFVNGAATTIQEVLQAGTAVLVDRFGVPRARCYCGNPLTPPVAVANPQYTGPNWSGFEPSQTEVIEPGPAVTTLVLIGIPTGGPFYRNPGPNDGADTPAPPSALAGSPFAPTGTPVSTRTVLACTSWDIGGASLAITQGNQYTPTAAFTNGSKSSSGAVTLTGTMTLPEGQWEAAGDQSASNSLKGTIVGSVISFTVTEPRTSGGTSLGFYQGTIAAAGGLVVGAPIAIEVIGFAQDKSTTPPGPKVLWSGTGRATCLHTARVAAPPGSSGPGPTTAAVTTVPTSQTTIPTNSTTTTTAAGQAPPSTAPPQTTQPPTCRLPGSISLQGTNPSSLPGSGGSATVVSLPVVISTGPLTSCGQHYRLAMTSSGGGYYTDCEDASMSDDVSGSTAIGDMITVSLEPPPNACG